MRISGSSAGYNMFRDSMKSTGYPLHSPVSPSLPFPYITVRRHISPGVYRELDAFNSLCVVCGYWDSCVLMAPKHCSVTSERAKSLILALRQMLLKGKAIPVQAWADP